MTRTIRNTIMLMAMLLPSFAFAANLFDLPAGDVSLKVLGAIFGGLMDSGGSDPLLNGIKAFNGGCLIIGGVLAGYTILAGTLNTAHDGEMLGKKFSSVWIPVRYSVGTALVLPVVGGGYCVMQAIVMWLVIQGIGLADTVWSGFMNNPTSAASPSVTSTQKEKVLAIAEDAFKASICYQSYARAISESDSLLKWGQYTYTLSQTSDGWVYGDSTSSLRRDGCGQVYYPQSVGGDSTTSNTTPSTNSGYLGDIGTIFAPMDMSAIQQAHHTQTDTLVQSMDSLAKSVLASAPAGQGVSMTPDQASQYYSQIQQAATNYINGIQTTANGLSTGDAFDKIKSTASNQGWILAGAWFTRIVQMNDRIERSVASTGSSDSPGLSGMDSLIFGDAKKYMQATDLVLKSKKDSVSGTSSSGSTDPEKGEVKSASGTFGINKAESVITGVLTGVNLYELKNDTRHPLIIINELGNRLIAACMGIMAGLVGLVIAGGVVASMVGAGGVLNAAVSLMGWFVDVPIKILMGTAMGCEYIIPNMPFIIWIGCIVGWVLLVIEAIIAAPLWAIMHLHPNGDDMTGRAGNGYTLVLSLLLRPVLMVFGMEAAIIISGVIGEFINKTFFEVFANSTGAFTGFSAITALAMGTVLYFIVLFIFIRKCFGIIHQLPDQLLQWIGGGGGQLGQFAGEFAGAADKGGQAGAALGGFTASALAKGGAKAGAKIGGKIGANIKNQLGQKQIDDANIKGEVGDGATAFRDQFAGMNEDSNLDPNALFTNNYSKMRNAKGNRDAYNDSLLGVAATDKHYGRADFESAFAESAADNHSKYGGDVAKASFEIGQNLMARNLSGGQYGDFALPAARNAEGVLDSRRAKSVIGTIEKMESRIGPVRTKDILDKAVATGTTGNDLVKQAEVFYKEELAKPIDPTPPSGGIDGENQG